ncbi:hypothetical protein ACVWW3_002887 [Bradyrhizobium sp. LM2.9]
MSEISTRDAARDSARDALRDNARDNAMSVAAISSERAESDDNVWTRRLVLFLRVMALLSILKGLYHWAQVTGFVGGEDEAFENQSMAWQAATVYFAVIELVAAVGLWLATPLGRGGVADDRGVDGGDRADVPWHLRRQPGRGRGRSLHAGRLSRARLDGRARAAAIGEAFDTPIFSCPGRSAARRTCGVVRC